VQIPKAQNAAKPSVFFALLAQVKAASKMLMKLTSGPD